MSNDNLSWSDRLFLLINAHVGSNKLLDALMIFCANWLIVFLALLTGFLVLRASWSAAPMFVFVVLIGSVLALGAHWALALAMPHNRPHIRFPKSRQLIMTLQNYKSFPSDHTTIAVLFTTVAFPFVGAEIGTVLVMSALLIGIARVYAGVHFPADILGGIVSGFLFSYFGLIVARLVFNLL